MINNNVITIENVVSLLANKPIKAKIVFKDVLIVNWFLKLVRSRVSLSINYSNSYAIIFHLIRLVKLYLYLFRYSIFIPLTQYLYYIGVPTTIVGSIKLFRQ